MASTNQIPLMARNQGRLNSTIGPRAKLYTGAPIYTTTRTSQNIHRLAWGPYARGGSGQLPSVPVRLDDPE